MKKEYKIAILGGYGLRNFGDDALMYVLHKIISSKYQEKDIVYICTPEKYLKKIVNSSNVIDINRDYDLHTDILLYGGGTQFYSFKPKPSLLYRIVLNLKNPLLLLKKIKKRIFKQRGIKVTDINRTSAVGIGVGPFLPKSDKNIELNTKKLFLSMGFVGVRDVYSFNKCTEWGLNNIKQYADLCYLMDDELNFEDKKTSTKIKKIGIIVRDWTHTDEGASYYDKIIPLMSELTQSGYEVNIIIFSQKRDIYWLNKVKNSNNVLIWNADKDSIEKFLVKLDNFDLFITARYHGAVFSTLLGKPFISIGIEQKLEMISDLYHNGSKKWLYPFDIQECSLFVKEIDKNYCKYNDNIIFNTKIQKQLAQKMIKDFIDYSNEGKI